MSFVLRMMSLGPLAGSAATARNSTSPDCEFEPHARHRNHLKRKWMSLRERWNGEGVGGEWLSVWGAVGGVWAGSDRSGSCLHPVITMSQTFACLG